MKHAETLITGIEYKVRKLTEKNYSLKAENDKLNGELRSLKAQIENLIVIQREL